MSKLLLAAWICAALSGCASIQTDRGSHASESLITERSSIKSVSIADRDNHQRTQELLAKTLTVDDAVQVALLNNPHMRMLYAELGVAQADLYDAGHLANPSFGFMQLSASGAVTKTTLSVSQRITELLFLHFNSNMARSEVLQTQQRVANAVLSLEADVRAAYYQYVTARMIASLRSQIARATSASSKYAEALYAAGNISQLQLNREQIAASESLIEEHRAALGAQNKYATLLNLMSVSGDMPGEATIKFDERLPQPSEAQFDLSSLQNWSLAQRLDIAATREALKTARQQLQHARHWRWLGVADAGVERERDRSAAAATGPAVNLEIPLFNHGGSAVMRKRAEVEVLNANLQSAELTARNNIAAQLETLSHARQIAEQYQHVLVPLHDQVVSLNQQRFNYMLIGAPDVLLAKQQALNAHQQYLQSVGDYWLAYVELQRIAGGKLPGEKAANDLFIQLDEGSADSSTSVVHQ